MRLVIDLQGAQTESRFRGIGRYSMSLAQGMVRNAGDHDVWIAVNGTFPEGIEEIRAGFEGLLPASRIRVIDTLPGVTWTDPRNAWRRRASELMWEAGIAALQPDIVHVSSLFEGAQGGAVTSIGRFPGLAPAAMTLYDLIPLLNPEKYLGSDWGRAWYFDKLEMLKCSPLLLSISAHAREEALQALQIEPDRIVNMSSAISPHFRPLPIGPAERAMLHQRFGVRDGYIMYSGAMEPRKNAERLLQAFALLGDALLAGHQLVIAGKISSHDMVRFNGLTSQLGIADRVVYTGYITDDELIALYSAASLYVFPSLHEGFGLPALEAMACGTPTIGSATTSVPEVIGRADALFDPTSVADIARAMRRVLEEPAFAASLRAHAPQQAARFSWDTTACTALAAFEQVVASRPRQQRVWPASRDALDGQYRQLVRAIGAIATDVPATDDDLLAAAPAIARATQAGLAIARGGDLPARLDWRVEGPFDSSYSLALVNRSLAMALRDRGHNVVLHSTEGPGDFPASPDFLAANPDIARLHAGEPTMPAERATVSSRMLYPPRVADMASRINTVHLYPWEESGFPQAWMEDFNTHLQGISCLSTHVRKIMVDNGASIPLSVGCCGVDHWLQIVPDAGYRVEGRGFRFLHVSSCFPRKGVDALLHAYGQAFTSADDVSLIIKTFANPHNEVHRWLAEASEGRTDYPDVRIIEGDISDAELKSLYSQCHALVSPSRAEGFGLPMAEAMLMDLPVITTAWGGQLDFCTPETAWLVDYSYVRARTHFNLHNSVWAEPDVDALAAALREVHGATPAQLAARSDKAKALLLERFKWSDIAATLEDDVRHFARAPELPSPRTGWITTWNTRCGIATYSSNLVDGLQGPVSVLAASDRDRTFDDGPEVVRCWTRGFGDDLSALSAEIDRQGLQALVIQFQYAFFDFPHFARFLEQQKDAGRTVVLVMHATLDAAETPTKQLRMLGPALARCDRVLVHAIADLNRLKAVGVERNTALFPHGIMEAPPTDAPVADKAALRLVSYGFFLPHKGLLELIEAVGILAGRGVDVTLTMVNAEYPDPVSAEQIRLAQESVKRLRLQSRVRMITGFLRDADSMAHLQQADVVVFPYQATGESASGAVRYGLASGRPVAVTPISIFDDVGDIVHRLPGTSAAELAQGLQALGKAIAGDEEAVRAVRAQAADWRAEHRYPVLARRLESITRQLASASVGQV